MTQSSATETAVTSMHMNMITNNYAICEKVELRIKWNLKISENN